MAITFVTEDGTGLSTATSYITAAEYAQFLLDAGLTDPCTTDDERQAALNRCAPVIDAFATWRGERLVETQALEWPRSDAYYSDGIEISSSTVPAEIKKALAYFVYYMKSGTDIMPTRDGAPVKSESSGVGALSESKSYWYSSKITPEISEISMILRRLVRRNSMALGICR